MSYEPTTWKAGDTVTSAKLNKIEQGISEISNNKPIAVITCTRQNNILTLNNTWAEIFNLSKNNLLFIDSSDENEYSVVPIIYVGYEDEVYYISCLHFTGYIDYTANSESDYPSFNAESEPK